MEILEKLMKYYKLILSLIGAVFGVYKLFKFVDRMITETKDNTKAIAEIKVAISELQQSLADPVKLDGIKRIVKDIDEIRSSIDKMPNSDDIKLLNKALERLRNKLESMEKTHYNKEYLDKVNSQLEKDVSEVKTMVLEIFKVLR